jgi:hypothetical protein
VNPYVDAIRRAATVIEVPGTPRSLRLDGATVMGSTLRVYWSFLDPEVVPGDPRSPVRRVHGETASSLESEEVGTGPACWAEVQLAAAHRYKFQIDADWLPGEHPIRRVWTVDDAWTALLGYLAAQGAAVRARNREVTVEDASATTTYHIDPAEWAEYLNSPEASGDSAIVPAATPLVYGLPIWAADELEEAAGAWGPQIALINGQLIGLRELTEPAE